MLGPIIEVGSPDCVSNIRQKYLPGGAEMSKYLFGQLPSGYHVGLDMLLTCLYRSIYNVHSDAIVKVYFVLYVLFSIYYRNKYLNNKYMSLTDILELCHCQYILIYEASLCFFLTVMHYSTSFLVFLWIIVLGLII